MNQKTVSNSSGFSLISVMTASAIMAVVILGFAQFMANQHKSMMGVNQKFDALKLQQALVRTMADPLSCSCLMNPAKSGIPIAFSVTEAKKATADDTEGPIVNLPKVFAGCDASGGPGSGAVLAETGSYLDKDPSKGIFISAVALRNIRYKGPGNEYQGDVSIHFGNKDDDLGPSLVGIIRPAVSKVAFTADVSGNVIDCEGADLDNFFQDKVTENTNIINGVVQVAGPQVASYVDTVERTKEKFTEELVKEKERILRETTDSMQTIIANANTERDRIIREATDSARIIAADGAAGKPGDPPSPPVGGPLDGRPQIVGVSNGTSGGIVKVDVQVSNGSVADATAWEVVVSTADGRRVQASSPKSGTGGKTIISVFTGSLSGEAVNVFAFGVGPTGRSIASTSRSITAP